MICLGLTTCAVLLATSKAYNARMSSLRDLSILPNLMTKTTEIRCVLWHAYRFHNQPSRVGKQYGHCQEGSNYFCYARRKSVNIYYDPLQMPMVDQKKHLQKGFRNYKMRMQFNWCVVSKLPSTLPKQRPRKTALISPGKTSPKSRGMKLPLGILKELTQAALLDN